MTDKHSSTTEKQSIATDKQSTKVIGKPIDRVEGRLKVTGKAKYAAEIPTDRVAIGVVIQSEITLGRITKIDRAAAESAPGVLAVYTCENPPMRLTESKPGKNLFLLQDNHIRFAGQVIGLVVAESFEQAVYAASLVEFVYDKEKAQTNIAELLDKPKELIEPPESHYARGDLAAGKSAAAVLVEETYRTPMETHNPMEPISTIASWDRDFLTLHDSTQAVFGVRDNVATILGIAPEKVRVIAHYTGGGFGCKLSTWAPPVLAAMAARKLDRPVKVVLSRQQMFGPVGFRPATVQAITLGAKADGSLTVVEHHAVQEASKFADFMETVSASSRSAYACANLETSHRWAQLDIGKPTWMRAPGHASGSFAIESAMDELAYKLNIDPIELRIKNYADKDFESGLPWSSNPLRECYKQGAQRFGWDKRKAQPGSIREGNQLIGMGMATAIHGYWHNPATASVELLANGTAIVQSGSQEIGTGTYTVMTQVAAEKLTLPIEKVTFALGDTNMPKAPMSGGSTTAASVGAAVAQASLDAITKLKQVAVSDKQSVFFNADVKEITAVDGMLVSASQPNKTESFAAIVSRTKGKRLAVQTTTEPAETEKNYSISAFGAQFAEVRVDADLGIIHVVRFVGAYAAGRILNAKTARSQLLGGITFGIGMALTEQTITDHKFGRVINADLAEYHLPVHADIGAIDPFFVEDKEEQANILGVKGVGEVGITGVAAAIANAIYNATGKRIRDLPITIDQLL